MTSQRGPLARALLLAYAFRVVGAALLTFPLTAGVGASGILNFSEGDAKLFENGGSYLLELLIADRALLARLLVPTVVLLSFTALASVVPEWILLRSLRHAAGGTSRAIDCTLREAGRSLRRLALIAISTWLARALLVLATLGVWMTARSFLVGAADERLPALAAAVAAPIGLLGWVYLSVLHDVAAIQISLEDAPPARAVAAALAALRRNGLRLGLIHAATALAALILVAIGAVLSGELDVSRGTGGSLFGVALTHQGVILAQLGLRAVWFWSALAVLGRPRTAAVQAEAFL